MFKPIIVSSAKKIQFGFSKRFITAHIIPPSKYDEAQNLLRQCYEEELLTNIFKFTESDYEAEFHVDREILSKGLSTMFLEPKTDKIIAVCLGETVKFPVNNPQLFIYKNETQFNKLLSVINLGYHFVNIPKALNGKIAYEHSMTAVSSEYRKSGFARKGLQSVYDVAKKVQASSILGTPTHPNILKLSINMGYTIKSIPFSEFKDEDGNPLIENIPPTNTQLHVSQYIIA